MRTLPLILALALVAAASASAASAAAANDRGKRLRAPPTTPLAATNEAGMIAVLVSDAPLKDKIDACREIGRIGTPAAVPALATLLADTNLSHMARVALEMIPDEAAGAALRAALATTTGSLRTGVAGSLGVRRDEKAVPALAPLLKDADPVLAATVARALGRIGGDAAVKALEEAPADAPAAIRAAVGEGLLRCADTAGAGRASRAIYDRVRAGPFPVPVQMAALRGAILVRGDEGVPVILAALNGTNGVEITTALRAARELSGRDVTKQLAAALGTIPAGLRSTMAGILGARGDRTAAPALTEAARAGTDKPLRLASIAALVHLSAESAVPVLATLALDADTDVAGAARDALGSMPGRKADDAVLALMTHKDPAVRAIAVDLVAQRAPADAGARLLAAASDTDEKVRITALRALKTCAGVADMPALLALLAKGPTAAEGQTIEAALAAICAREIRKTPARVTIVKAVYGALPEGPSADVTAKVAEKIQAGLTSFEADNGVFGDPAGGKVKSLAVTYTANGIQATRTVREGEVIAFPPVSADPACADLLLKALPSAAPATRLALLRVLASTGGPKAFAAIHAAAAGTDAATSGAALRILCEWPTALALPALRDAMNATTDASVKLLALRGTIRLIPFSEDPPAAKLAALDALSALVQRPDEQRLLLAALGQIPSPEALERAMKALDVPAVKQEAAAAAVAIGEAIVRTHADLVSEAMKKVMPAADNGSIRRRAKDLIRETKP